MGFCETFLSTKYADAEITINGYNCERRDRIAGAKGGIVVYVKDNIDYVRRLDIEESNVESIWMELYSKHHRNILCGFIYRSPSEKVSWMDNFEKQLYIVKKYPSKLLIFGDFNMDLLKMKNTSKWNILINSYDLNQIVQKPTRICSSTETLIDHVYTSTDVDIQEMNVPKVALSDHFPVVVTVGKLNSDKNGTHKIIQYRGKPKISENQIIQSVRDKLLELNMNCGVNHGVNTFTNVLSESYNRYRPIIQKRIKNEHKVPWINDKVRHAMRQRDKMKSHGNTRKYKWWRNYCVKLIRANKKYHYQSIIKNANGDPKKLWSHISGFSKTKNNGSLKALSVNDETVTDKCTMANLLNNHFATVSSKLLGPNNTNDKYTVPAKLKDYIQRNKLSNEKFVIPPVSENFVKEQLLALNTKKSTGNDGINAGFLRLCTPSIVSTVTNLINDSIQTSVFPTAWKIAKVTALLKGGKATELNNYRPISILSTVSKIIERHVYNHMYSYFCENKLMSDNQSGFRAGFSCETCLLKMTTKWYQALDKGDIIGCVALDLSKAFDVLNFNILLKKLEAYGCHDNVIKWFYSYLQGRKQYVKIGDITSGMLNLENGVPQGSILGPLIFSIYINDMPLCLEYVHVDLYADDTTLYFVAKDVSDVEKFLAHDLNNFTQWCFKNKLVINKQKSKCILIYSRQRARYLEKETLSLFIDNTKLECVEKIKILGLIIDKNLTWQHHINNLCQKLSLLVGLLWRIRSFLTYEMKLLFYNSFILSRMDYCICIWGGASNIYLDKLYKLQKRAARIILNIDLMEMETDCMFNTLKWMDIYQRIYFKRSIYMYEIFYNLLPFYIVDMFVLKESTNYVLRSNKNIFNFSTQKPNTESYKRSFLYNGTTLWNKLSDSVKQIKSVNQFKHALKSHIFHVQSSHVL
jgi:hypothetical protein